MQFYIYKVSYKFDTVINFSRQEHQIELLKCLCFSLYPNFSFTDPLSMKSDFGFCGLSNNPIVYIHTNLINIGNL